MGSFQMFKLLEAMPSPSGRNDEKLFIPARREVQLAYDSAGGMNGDLGRRRRARDAEPLTAEGAMQEIEELFEELPEEEALDLVSALRERLAGQAEDRRPRRIGRDMPPAFPGRPTPGSVPVGLPPEPGWDRRRRLGRDVTAHGTAYGVEVPEGEDRRRGARDRRGHAMDSAVAGRLPSFSDLWGLAPGQHRLRGEENG
jgi:hypothetical protein